MKTINELKNLLSREEMLCIYFYIKEMFMKEFVQEILELEYSHENFSEEDILKLEALFISEKEKDDDESDDDEILRFCVNKYKMQK